MTIDPNILISVYNRRPDLQAVYYPDGTKRDPKNPSPSTLQDWAVTFGIREVPELDPRNATLSKYFSPEEIKGMPEAVKTSLSAFADVQQKNFDETGKINWEINSKNLEDAMRVAEKDPELKARYGDELTTSIGATNTALKMLEQGYTQEQAAIARTQAKETKDLAEIEAAAGRAYSGFRAQAEDRLKKDQTDIVQSSKRQMQSALQGIVGPLEQRFGTDFIKSGKINLPKTDITYKTFDKTGGNEVTGDFEFDKKNAIKDLALTDFYPSTETPQ